MDKDIIGTGPNERVCNGETESTCNLIANAEVFNAAETDFNNMPELCFGHNSMFIKYSQAMAAVFALKDRPIGCDSLAAIYTCDSY